MVVGDGPGLVPESGTVATPSDVCDTKLAGSFGVSIGVNGTLVCYSGGVSDEALGDSLGDTHGVSGVSGEILGGSSGCFSDDALGESLGGSTRASQHNTVDSTAVPFVRPLGTGQTLAVLGNSAAAAVAGFVDGKVYKGRVRVLSKDDCDWMFVMKKDGVVAPVPSTGGNVPRPCTHCKAGLKKGKDVCYRVANGQHPAGNLQVLSISLDVVED